MIVCLRWSTTYSYFFSMPCLGVNTISPHFVQLFLRENGTFLTVRFIEDIFESIVVFLYHGSNQGSCQLCLWCYFSYNGDISVPMKDIPFLGSTKSATEHTLFFILFCDLWSYSKWTFIEVKYLLYTSHLRQWFPTISLVHTSAWKQWVNPHTK